MTDQDESMVAPSESFTVRDANSANWVIRKILEARVYAARVEAWAELEQRRAQREEDGLLRRFGADLEAWTRSQIAAQRDRRTSVSLPAGVVGYRTEPTKLAVCDETALLAWCRANLPTAIRTVESVQKTPLTHHFKATGECPEGTECVGGGQRFHITAKIPKNLEGANDGEVAEEDGE